MVVTDVKIRLLNRNNSKLLAFASITIDRCFIVRDIKVIQGNQGLFVAMPSRKVTDHCPACRAKNALQSKFCNQCGTKLPSDRNFKDAQGHSKLHSDLLHLITVKCRQEIQGAVLKAFDDERLRSQKPGYTQMQDEELEGDEIEEPVSGGGVEGIEHSTTDVPLKCDGPPPSDS